MGRRGTVRRDLPATCPECRRELRPCNLERHLRAAHPEAHALVELERAKLRALVRSG